ncbi:hypothetical protein AAG742_00600 [Micrococcus sp. 2A]|uniref:hypothetical protein n=1 Tax=Micrococcus TaxID=1269 RepID=UPI001CDAB68A|nr:hypothetical protein [Micrococcus luteus]
MKICVKISDMSSCHLGVPVSPMRPSEFSDDAKAALQYLAGVLHIAFEEAQIALRRFPPSRAEKWVVRTQLKDMCHPLRNPDTARRLADHGIRVDYSTQGDLFWFRVVGCEYNIRLVTRPKNSPDIPASGVFRQEALDMDGDEFGDDTRLYLMMHAPQRDLVAVTLALASNKQRTWVYRGPNILDEVLVFNAGSAVVAPLPREDESFFRNQMARRPEQPIAENAETFADEGETGDVQHGGENAGGF